MPIHILLDGMGSQTQVEEEMTILLCTLLVIGCSICAFFAVAFAATAADSFTKREWIAWPAFLLLCAGQAMMLAAAIRMIIHLVTGEITP